MVQADLGYRDQSTVCSPDRWGRRRRSPVSEARHVANVLRCTLSFLRRVRYRGGVRKIYWNLHRRVDLWVRRAASLGEQLGRSVKLAGSTKVRVDDRPIMVDWPR
jgi:hypothetical protein